MDPDVNLWYGSMPVMKIRPQRFRLCRRQILY